MATSSKYLFALHDIEEFIRSSERRQAGTARLYYSGEPNRREKDILQFAGKKGVASEKLSDGEFFRRCSRELGDPAPKGLRHLLLEIPGGYLESRQSDSDLWKLLEESGDENSLVLILDGITDPHNLGAIIRSANLMNVEAVVLPKKRSAAVNDTVRKVSAGASHHTPVIYVPNLVRVMEKLKEIGYWVYCADMNGTPPHQQKLTGKSALVMGSEGAGPSREVAKHADAVITIPSAGQIDSFNVSVATGILLYEIRRQSGFFSR